MIVKVFSKQISKAVIIFFVFLTSILLSACDYESPDQKTIRELRANLVEYQEYYQNKISSLERQLRNSLSKSREKENSLSTLENSSKQKISSLENELENLRNSNILAQNVIDLIEVADFSSAVLLAGEMKIDTTSIVAKDTIELLSSISKLEKIENALGAERGFRKAKFANSIRTILQNGALFAMGAFIALTVVGCAILVGNSVRIAQDAELRIAELATSVGIILGYFFASTSFNMNYSKFMFGALTGTSQDSLGTEINSFAPLLATFFAICIGLIASKLFSKFFFDGTKKSSIGQVAIASLIFVYAIESSLFFLETSNTEIPLANAGFVLSILVSFIYRVSKKSVDVAPPFTPEIEPAAKPKSFFSQRRNAEN